jgi:hypothetical protein
VVVNTDMYIHSGHDHFRAFLGGSRSLRPRNDLRVHPSALVAARASEIAGKGIVLGKRTAFLGLSAEKVLTTNQ